MVFCSLAALATTLPSPQPSHAPLTPSVTASSTVLHLKPSFPHFSQQVCLDSKDVIRQNARSIHSYTTDFTFYLVLFCF